MSRSQVPNVEEHALTLVCPGNFELLKEILANANQGQIQVSVNKQNSMGWAPLLAAASRGHIDIVNSLLECNAR